MKHSFVTALAVAALTATPASAQQSSQNNYQPLHAELRRLDAASASEIERAGPAVIRQVREAILSADPAAGPIRPLDQFCRDMLGQWWLRRETNVGLVDTNQPTRGSIDPRTAFATNVRGACTDSWTQWLATSMPRLQERLKKQALIDLDNDTPLLPADRYCTVMLGNVVPRVEPSLSDAVKQLTQGCVAAVKPAIDTRIAKKVAEIIDRGRNAQITFDGLRRAKFLDAVFDDFAFLHREAHVLRADAASRVHQALEGVRSRALPAIAKSLDESLRDTVTDHAKIVRVQQFCEDARRFGSVPTADGKNPGYAFRQSIGDLCDKAFLDFKARRCQLALTHFDPGKAFSSARFSVSAPDGRLLPVDMRRLVCAAGSEGLQVTLSKSGLLWTTYSISIQPFSARRPALTGTLEEHVRPDGVKSFRVAKLDDVPGLDGPAETLICLRDTVERQFDERILTSVAAAAVALWGEPGSGGTFADLFFHAQLLGKCNSVRETLMRRAQGQAS